MNVQIDIDNKLLSEAQKTGHFSSSKETVRTALQEMIKKNRQQDIISLFDTIPYDENYDYKTLRTR